ncbi:MAG: reprolysin-like metallopeptidase [Bacteroidota bacterium]
MNYKYIKKALLVSAILCSTLAFAQSSNSMWERVDAQKARQSEQFYRKTVPFKETFYQLDISALKSALSNVGDRFSSNKVEVMLPSNNGKFYRYSVSEASILDPVLQAQHPDIRSYVAQGIDNPTELVRFSITPKGFHAMIMGTGRSAVFIDPFSKNENIYTVYSRRDLEARSFGFECGVVDEEVERNAEETSEFARNADDGNLRTYRLALACTGEYAAFHVAQAGVGGGTDAQQRAAVLAAMNVTMTRVNGIYERDLSITMTLVPNNNIIFLNGATDPFNNNSAGILINQSQSVIDSFIGNANYDIGHTFSTGGGGLAGLGVSCEAGNKARGITGLPAPVGDAYDVDFVAHELGHQFGAPHTFNGSTGNCGAQRTASNAYEPGSGTTIMAYAGICGAQNVQNNSDAYFHQKSLQVIWDDINAFPTCALQTPTGNSAPTSNAGANFTIPAGTPYKLTGSSTDIDGTGTHTYTWEQYDLGPQGAPSATSPTAPIVRSFEGTSNPTRFIPNLPELLNNGGTSTDWEILTLISRTMNYRLTVRDNDSRGGQTAVDEMTITVNNASAFFSVTSQNTSGISWDVGTTQTVTWNVAGTTGNGINEANVNILLSTDGGLNFDTVLAANTPNDGSQDIIVPNVSSVNCRIMVEAANNIFFNVNSQAFAVGASLTCNDYEANNVNAAIPDGLGTMGPVQGPPLFDTLNVPDDVTIESMTVTVDISHTFIGDFIIQLQHPDIVTDNSLFVNIYVGECGSNDDLSVTFEDGAAAITCATPTTGTVSPSNPLSLFDGLSSQGDWTIAIVDFFAGDTGTLNSWSLEFCTTSGLSVEDEELLSDLSIYPNPNNGAFNVSFNPRSGEDITIDVYDIQGRTIFSKSFNSVSRFEEAIRLNNAQSGVYLMRISEGRQEVTKKIVVN